MVSGYIVPRGAAHHYFVIPRCHLDCCIPVSGNSHFSLLEMLIAPDVVKMIMRVDKDTDITHLQPNSMQVTLQNIDPVFRPGVDEYIQIITYYKIAVATQFSCTYPVEIWYYFDVHLTSKTA